MLPLKVYYKCPLQSQNPSSFDEVKRVLTKAGIVLSPEYLPESKTAILIWLEQCPIESVVDVLYGLQTKGCRIIVLHLNDYLAESTKWHLMRIGASDIIDFNSHKEFIANFIKSRIERWSLVDEIINSNNIKNTLIGESNCWKKFLSNLVEAACFTDCNILLMGQSGTGKEALGALVHKLDHRKEKGEFVVLDCTTISQELSGSEFYGHEKGAFTNAISSRDGAFAQANNGTLFLDELGEMPLSMQAGLLRVVQEKTYKKVGSNLWKNTDFRLVAATNKDLRAEIKSGRFREDLYFRIASAVFKLPPLCNRREDIPELVRHFLRQELKVVASPEIDPLVMNYLVSKEYPGNIRELKQLVRQIAMRYTGQSFITVGDLPEEEFPDSDNINEFQNNQNNNIRQSLRMAILSGKDLAKIKSETSQMAMEIALEESGGNLKIAARKLNVEVRTLQYIRQKNNNTLP